MKQPIILISFFIVSLRLQAQDTSAYYRHEFNLGCGLGTDFELNFKPRAYFDANGHFPSEDSLNKMDYSTFSAFDSHQWFLSYTKWFENRRKINGFQHGVKAQIGGWRNISLSEHWKSSERWTYDTVVNPVTGNSFFQDSIRKDEYSSTFTASHFRFSLGYRLLIPIEDRFELSLGMDFGITNYFKKKITYAYRRIEDKNSEDDEFPLEDSQNVIDRWSYSWKDDLNMSTYSISLPVEFRFVGEHAGHGEIFKKYYDSWYKKMLLSILVNPGYYFVNIDGSETNAFAITVGLAAAFCF